MSIVQENSAEHSQTNVMSLPIVCDHCGQAMPGGAEVEQQGHRFCCHGCAAAYELIHAEGLDDYYALRNRFASGNGPTGQVLSSELFAELDSPSYWKASVSPAGPSLVKTRVYLEGIHCAACVWLLEKLHRIEPSISSTAVNLTRSTLDIVWNPTETKLSKIAQILARIGYIAHPLRGEAAFQQRAAAQRKQLAQIGIAFACSGNSMLLAAALYAGEYHGMSLAHIELLRGASTVVGLVALLGPGASFFRGAWHAIKARTPHMDIPVAIGLAVGAASGLWNTLRGSGELYYDSLSMLVFLLLVGRYIQTKQQQSAIDSVEILTQLTPRLARRVRDGAVEVVSCEAIQSGETVEVLEGETIPVDGRVVSGVSEVDQSLLTGETLPVPVKIDSQVVAGAINRVSPLRIVADQVGSNTRVGLLAQSIQDSSIRRAPLVQLADRLAGRFVIAVLVVAVVTGVVWSYIDPDAVTDRVISLLIVACPCALGLATPLAVALALGRGAQRGILIKGGDTLQRMAKPGILLLDKTGTLTTGEMEIRHWYSSDPNVLRSVVQLEKQSRHPIAQAFRLFESSGKIEDPTNAPSNVEATDVRYLPGCGLEGEVGNQLVRVGSRVWLESEGVSLSSKIVEELNQVISRCWTPLLVACDGVAVAVAGIGDRVRPEAKQVLANLASQNWKIGILSGDHPAVVRNVAEQLNIQPEYVWGGESPEGKLNRVRDLQSLGHEVVMVGDGVNDAAALSKANVGIAVRGGAEISLQAASVYLQSANLNGIEQLACAAKKSVRLIQRTFIASASYNAFAVGLAALGWIHPLIAALLMPVSSITVVTLTLASGVFQEKAK